MPHAQIDPVLRIPGRPHYLEFRRDPEGFHYTYPDGRIAGKIDASCADGRPIRWVAIPKHGTRKTFYSLEAAEYYVLAMAVEATLIADRKATVKHVIERNS